MGLRSNLIFFITFIVLFLIFNIPPYSGWLKERISAFNTDMYENSENSSFAYRKQRRLGASYQLLESIRKQIESVGEDPNETLVLIPPQEYILANGSEMGIPEPIIWYYMNGMKAAYPTSKNVYEAKWAIKASESHVYMIRMKSKGAIDSVLAEYKNIQRIEQQ
ncbi:MAG: hypothetical protein JST82_05105 [Bacteroidetes bacterium]|nr:hypothetical protein [Bacteroidota bacterium]